jgi:hypothetical protein
MDKEQSDCFIRYHCQDKEELVAYWRNRAAKERIRASELSPRSHEHKAMMASATAMEFCAEMLASSNLVVKTSPNNSQINKCSNLSK